MKYACSVWRMASSPRFSTLWALSSRFASTAQPRIYEVAQFSPSQKLVARAPSPAYALRRRAPARKCRSGLGRGTAEQADKHRHADDPGIEQGFFLQRAPYVSARLEARHSTH